MGTPFKAVVLSLAGFCPRGLLAMSEDTLDGPARGRGGPGLWWVVAKADAAHPAVQRKAPPQRVIQPKMSVGGGGESLL